MQPHDLQEVVTETAARFSIPGVAIGISIEGRDQFACSGITSIENPLPVDKHTLFVAGSVTKPFTATALVQLVVNGHLSLAQPVRSLVPEFGREEQPDEQEMTLLHLPSIAAWCVGHCRNIWDSKT